MARDDFDGPTRKSLAERAGYLCSFPGCGALTIGPSDEAIDATSGTGMACHIAAASGGPGARRYRPEMAPAERRSIANGVWLCYTHGKLIDTDDSRFTIPMLKTWRELAEFRARLLQENGRATSLEFSSTKLPEEALTLVNLDGESEIIGDTLRFSCLPEIWGLQTAGRVRDLIIEIARNALTHGGASQFTMNVEADHVRLHDDGKDFDLWRLTETSNSGGGIALKAIQVEERLIVANQRRGAQNEVVIALIREAFEIEELTPCFANLSWRDIRKRTWRIEADPSCRLVYVILPQYLTPSDSVVLIEQIQSQSHDSRRLVFVLQSASDTSRRLIVEAFPESRILAL